MTTKFIVRLLDDAHNLLAWAEVFAEAKPQDRAASCPFWAQGPTPLVIERDGVASLITVHWADLDVARKQDILQPMEVRAGQVCQFGWMEPVWLVPGMRDIPLPPVTVKQSIVLAPAPAAIGAGDPRF